MAHFNVGDVVKTGDNEFSGTVIAVDGDDVTVENRDKEKRSYKDGDLKATV